MAMRCVFYLKLNISDLLHSKLSKLLRNSPLVITVRCIIVLWIEALGPVLLTLVASDSSRKPAFATLSYLLTCPDAIPRCDVAGNCCVSSPAGAGVCRSCKHGSWEPIDMLFHLQKLSQRHKDFRLWRVHVENMTEEELLGNFPVNWSVAHGLRRRYLAFPAIGVKANSGYRDHGHTLLTRDW